MNRRKHLPIWAFVPLLLFLPPADHSSVDVMSFNIRFGTANDGDNSWNARRELLLQVIRSRSPHLLGLQEALRFQLDEIRSAFPHYGESGRGRDDGDTQGEYSPILYDTTRFSPLSEGTFWFSPTPSTPGSVGWGNRITRICSWARLRDKEDSGMIDVYNVHLDHESQQSRYRSVQALLDTIRHRSSNNPILITGDFNAGETNPAVRLVREAGFSDTFRILHPRDSLVATFHAFTGSNRGEKIDYIFSDSQAVVVDAAILRDNIRGRYPSDHFPVIAKIKFINR